jgi:hypothetical protein
MAKMNKTIALLLGVVMATVLFMPISNAVGEYTGDSDVVNETVPGETDVYQDLEGHDIEDGSETVYWYNSTSDSYETLDSGTDYEMNYSAGEVNLLSSGEVSEGDNVTISYTYQQTDATTSTIIGLIPVLLAVLIIGTMGNRIAEMT